MFRCLIIDDEELARGLIKNHLSQLNEFEVVATCANAIEASRVLKQEQIDLLFLDIEMPVLRGTDFFKSLIHRPHVIFTTAYRDYAIEGFDLNAVDYLLKPITFSRFFEAIEKFLALKQKSIVKEVLPHEGKKRTRDHMFIRKDRKQVKLYFDDVLYVESVKDYIKIVESDQQHLVKYSITNFNEELDDRFLRIHRSFIVNKEKITAYTKHDVEIGKVEIPVGESYKRALGKI